MAAPVDQPNWAEIVSAIGAVAGVAVGVPAAAFFLWDRLMPASERLYATADSFRSADYPEVLELIVNPPMQDYVEVVALVAPRGFRLRKWGWEPTGLAPGPTVQQIPIGDRLRPTHRDTVSFPFDVVAVSDRALKSRTAPTITLLVKSTSPIKRLNKQSIITPRLK
jgi:hypothetical protein